MQETILTLLKDFMYSMQNDGETGLFSAHVDCDSTTNTGYCNRFTLSSSNGYDCIVEIVFRTTTKNTVDGRILNDLHFKMWTDSGACERRFLVFFSPEEIFQRSVGDLPSDIDGVLSEENTIQLRKTINYFLKEYTVDVLSSNLEDGSFS